MACMPVSGRVGQMHHAWQDRKVQGGENRTEAQIPKNCCARGYVIIFSLKQKEEKGENESKYADRGCY